MMRPLTDEVSLSELQEMRSEGLSNAEIAERLDVGVATIYRYLGPRPKKGATMEKNTHAQYTDNQDDIAKTVHNMTPSQVKSMIANLTEGDFATRTLKRSGARWTAEDGTVYSVFKADRGPTEDGTEITIEGDNIHATLTYPEFCALRAYLEVIREEVRKL